MSEHGGTSNAYPTRPPPRGGSPAGPGSSRPGSSRPGEGAGEDVAPATEHGRTVIADAVVSKIAGIAAREVAGVYDLGGGTARAVGALRGRLRAGRANLSQGVGVEVGDEQAAIDVDVVADYGVPIATLTEQIRQNVIAAVERMTGLEVTEVNVTVHDVHRADVDDADDAGTRGADGGEPTGRA